MRGFKDLEIHYAIEDIEDLKGSIEQLQTMIKAAEDHPEAMPRIADACIAIVILAVARFNQRLKARNEELEKLIEDMK